MDMDNDKSNSENVDIGSKVIDISELVNIFEAQEGEIEQIIGKTGNGKTYEGTRRALEYLKQGNVVYTTWRLILPDVYDERENFFIVFFRLIFLKKRFFVFDWRNNWKFLDIDRPDLIPFVCGLTDCIVFLDEGQDIFDSYEGRAMSKEKRKSLTRTRHLRKTLIIISQRAQAVAVTARANVTFFYKCVKTRSLFRPWANYFKIYRTEEMDDNNFPIWESGAGDTYWQAELWDSHYGQKEVYDSFNSWYLRAGIPKSQEVKFQAYDLTTIEKIKQLFRIMLHGKRAETVTKNDEEIEGINRERFEQSQEKLSNVKPEKKKKKLAEVLPIDGEKEIMV